MNALATPEPRSRLPRYRRVDNYPPITIGRPHRAIVEAVGRFHYLSAVQITLLLYSPASLTYVLDRCKALFHSGYVRRIYLPKATPAGSSRAIYALDAKGYRYLRSWGLAPAGRFRPSEEGQREEIYLRHTLSANDFLILARLLAKRDPGIVVAGTTTERELKRLASRVQVYNPDKKLTEKIAVIPDGELEIDVDGAYKARALLELDRGNEEVKVIRRKTMGLLARYGREPVRVAFVTTAGERRLAELVGWVEGVLREMNARNAADLFSLAAFDPDPSVTDPGILCQPVWRRPFSVGGHPLLERMGGQP